MKKRGNPAWYRGMPSANPKGRPKGRNSWAVFCNDPSWFLIKHGRWNIFCFELFFTKRPGNGAEAARRSGYSQKSARFIACRLRRKAVVNETLRRLVWLTCSPVDRWRHMSPPEVEWGDWGMWWKHIK